MVTRGRIARFWKNWLERNVEMAEPITLQVEGMSCGHCIRAVTNAIQGLDQAAKVEVDLAAKRVVAQTSLPRADVVRAVEEEGFAVKG
jgi:copper chaperone